MRWTLIAARRLAAPELLAEAAVLLAELLPGMAAVLAAAEVGRAARERPPSLRLRMVVRPKFAPAVAMNSF